MFKKIRPSYYTIYNNKLKMEKDLNVSSKTTKILEETIGGKISDTSCMDILPIYLLEQWKQRRK